MKINLTKPIIDKALQEGKRCSLWDVQVVGLYVEVRTSGKGSYLLRYTSSEHGKQSMTLGSTDIIKLDDARQKARELLTDVCLGNEPAHHKLQLKNAPTLNEVIDNYYLPHIKAYKLSWESDFSILKNHIRPALGHFKISTIQTEDIARLQRTMREKDLAAATCNRVVILLGFLFNLAINQWKLPAIKDNPARAVKQFKVDNQQQVFLSPEQIERLFIETQHCKQNPQLAYIVALLALTGVRKRNALNAKWSEFDEAKQT